MGIFTRIASASRPAPSVSTELDATLRMPEISAPALDVFLKDTTEGVIRALREGVDQDKGSRTVGENPQEQRLVSLERLLGSGERTRLERVVQGYLSHFIRQTLDQPTGYSTPTGELCHSRRVAPGSADPRPDIEWSAALVIVRHSAQLYKEDWAATFPDIPPCASVYNEYRRLSYGVMLERRQLLLNRAP